MALLIALVAALLGVACLLLFVLRLRWVDGLRRGRQSELRELLEVSTSREESQHLLLGHLERCAPGAAAGVLICDEAQTRLEVHLASRREPTPLGPLAAMSLAPRSCLAVRLSRPHERRQGQTPLLPCEACGKLSASTACQPILAGGRVIGAALLAGERDLTRHDKSALRDAAALAAPILAGQQSRDSVEERAASDALTGLPNRRAADESLRRMVAQAGRAITPLSAVMIDLDHFRDVNQVHGRERADQVLMRIGQMLAATVRASDLAARYGGEEFLLALPDTDRAGAIEVAEKLRRAIERTDMGELGTITASFGIATLPDDAVTAEQLLSRSDSAVYAAKVRGRNRVEVAAVTRGPKLSGLGPLDPPDGEDQLPGGNV